MAEARAVVRCYALTFEVKESCLRGRDCSVARFASSAAVALAFDLLALNGAALRKVLKRTRRGIQYVEHTEGDVRESFKRFVSLAWRGVKLSRFMDKI